MNIHHLNDALDNSNELAAKTIRLNMSMDSAEETDGKIQENQNMFIQKKESMNEEQGIVQPIIQIKGLNTKYNKKKFELENTKTFYAEGKRMWQQTMRLMFEIIQKLFQKLEDTEKKNYGDLHDIETELSHMLQHLYINYSLNKQSPPQHCKETLQSEQIEISVQRVTETRRKHTGEESLKWSNKVEGKCKKKFTELE